MTNKALAIHFRKSQALALEGQLLLTKALATHDPREKITTAHSAAQALERALKENPLVEREYGAALATARILQ
jgi:hypothetical protein